MVIKAISTIPRSAAIVFVLKFGEDITRHFFFSMLRADEKKYLRAFHHHVHKDGEYTHPIFAGEKKMIIVGVGSNYNHRKAILALRRIVATAKKEKISSFAIYAGDFPVDSPEIIGTQCEIANFEFNDYKAKPKNGWNFVEDIFVVADKKEINSIQEKLDNGKIIGEEMNEARILSNTPGSDMTPQRLADAAMRSGKRCGFKTIVLDEKEIMKLGMGGVLGVARGSSEKPRFIIAEYFGGIKKEKPVVLVGKGVTFDSGGLNLKPEQGIYEMHLDMSGGAAVFHTIAALARMKAKKNIVGLIPAVENMPSGSSYHPGDLLKTMSGKTIEVLNTDAEGRIILADGLTYAQRYKPRLVIDIATLTGAAMVALGQRASAIFTSDEMLEKTLLVIGERTGDFVWPLPLWEEYEEEIKGTFGDVANLGKTRYGGAITGAVFLWQFIKGMPWVHIDIAPRMTTIESEYLAKGSSGAPIPLLTNFLREY